MADLDVLEKLLEQTEKVFIFLIYTFIYCFLTQIFDNLIAQGFLS